MLLLVVSQRTAAKAETPLAARWNFQLSFAGSCWLSTTAGKRPIMLPVSSNRSATTVTSVRLSWEVLRTVPVSSTPLVLLSLAGTRSQPTTSTALGKPVAGGGLSLPVAFAPAAALPAAGAALSGSGFLKSLSVRTMTAFRLGSALGARGGAAACCFACACACLLASMSHLSARIDGRVPVGRGE